MRPSCSSNVHAFRRMVGWCKRGFRSQADRNAGRQSNGWGPASSSTIERTWDPDFGRGLDGSLRQLLLLLLLLRWFLLLLLLVTALQEESELLSVPLCGGCRTGNWVLALCRQWGLGQPGLKLAGWSCRGEAWVGRRGGLFVLLLLLSSRGCRCCSGGRRSH